MSRTTPRKRQRRRFLQAVERLEDRRLLTASSFESFDPALVREADDIPLDTSDWTTSTVSLRMGGLSESEIFSLQSKPDSDFTIYLDFDGHVTTGTIWNSNYGIDPIVSPNFDLDGDATKYNQMELERILVSWQRTAEDFAPFDINITTRDPGLDALTNSGGGDTTWGVRAVATFDTFANCGCGGHAFLNTFSDSVDTPTFIYNLGEGSLGETFSHEVGHMLGLVHDGDSTQTYYPGHGSGETQWGAIMGAPFDKNVTQWDQGEYFDANNQENDLLTITTQNGFGYRADDYGNSTAAAAPIDVFGGTGVSAYGIIERTSDRDYFSFDTGGGDVTFDFEPLQTRPNLDIFAALYDSTGTLVQLSNPGDQLAASISATVAAGTYFLRVEGVGSDDVYNAGTDEVDSPAVKPWQSSNPTGYSDYGSLGQYTVEGTIVASGSNTFSIEATDAVKPEGSSGQQAFTFTVSRTGNTSVAASVDYAIDNTLPAYVGATTPSPAEPSDFAGGTVFSDTLDFAANETTKTITLNVTGDTDFELDEYFDIRLSNPTTGWLSATSRATGIILSDESEFGISSVGANVSVNEGPYDGAIVRWRQIGAASGAFDEWAIDNISLTNSTFGDNFDPNINNANWSEISNGSVSTQFGGSGNALTMTGGTERWAATRLLDASPGDVMTFDIIFGDGTNGGENADPGEDVLLEFSLDGGSNWQQFAVFDTEDYTTWSTVQATLPTGIDTNPPSELAFTIVRVGGTAQSATVDWAVDTVGVSTPIDTNDFLAGVLPVGQVAFAAGESTAEILISVNPDLDFEPNEEFRVLLTGVSGAGTVTLDSMALAGFGEIINDDAAFNVNPGAQFRLRQFDNSGGDFDNWGIDNVNFTGGLLQDDFDPDIDLTQWDTVSFGQVNGNFGGSGNSLFFTGEGARQISTIPVSAQSGDVLSFDFIYGDDFNGGENPESGEEVVLEYSTDGGFNWTIMRTYNLNITNWTTMNEVVPADAIRPPSVQEEGNLFTFDVQRFGINTSVLESTVTWQVVGSGANPADASDFPGNVFPSGSLVFAPGETVKSVDISVVDDSLFEPDETFDFVINSSGGNPVATGTILNNDTMPNGDFDGDGDFDCDDVDALVTNVANQTNVATYDMNGDGALDLTDVDQWLAVAGSVNLPSGNAYLYGDANLDGTVDGLDFIQWNENKFSSGASWCGGDFNADGVTDGQDFIIWNDNKFTSSSIPSDNEKEKDLELGVTVSTIHSAADGLVRPQIVRPTTTTTSLGIGYKTPALSATTARRTDAVMEQWLEDEGLGDSLTR